MRGPLPVAPAIWLIAALLILGAMKFAAPVLMPAALALLFYLALNPLVVRLCRWRVPRVVAAILVMVAICVPVAVGIERLAAPAADWLRTAPADLRELRQDLAGLSGALDQVRSASEAVNGVVEELMPGEADQPPTVQVRGPGLLEVVGSRLPMIVLTVTLSIALCLLLLMGGRRPLLHAVLWSSRFAARRRAVQAAGLIEREVSRYLGTIVLVNLGLGISASVVFLAADLPNPALWGTVAGLFNFAPFVGPAVTTGVVAVVGLTTLDGLLESLVPALGYVALTSVEGQFVTPMVVGSRLEISPASALFAVIVMGWLWGVPGALVAVPLIVSGRIIYRAVDAGYRLPATGAAADPHGARSGGAGSPAESRLRETPVR